MWNLLPLDGYLEGPTPWDLAFHLAVWGDVLERFSIEQLRAADWLIFGRVTYEGMAAYWRTAQGEVAEPEQPRWQRRNLRGGDHAGELREGRRA